MPPTNLRHEHWLLPQNSCALSVTNGFDIPFLEKTVLITPQLCLSCSLFWLLQAIPKTSLQVLRISLYLWWLYDPCWPSSTVLCFSAIIELWFVKNILFQHLFASFNIIFFFTTLTFFVLPLCYNVHHHMSFLNVCRGTIMSPLNIMPFSMVSLCHFFEMSLCHWAISPYISLYSL